MIRKIVSTRIGEQAHRRLVEQQQARPRHQRAADGQHLLLAAGQRAALLRDALAQAREEREHALEVGARCRRGRPGRRRRARGSRARVIRGKMRRPSGDWRDAEPHDAVGRQRVQAWPLKLHGAAPRRGPCRGSSRRVVVLPAPLAPMSVTISPRLDGERHAAERADVAVVGVDVGRARACGYGSRAAASSCS